MLSYDFYHYRKLLFIDELLPLCNIFPFELCKKQFCDKIMSVLDMKTVKDIYLKLHTNIKCH